MPKEITKIHVCYLARWFLLFMLLCILCNLCFVSYQGCCVLCIMEICINGSVSICCLQDHCMRARVARKCLEYLHVKDLLWTDNFKIISRITLRDLQIKKRVDFQFEKLEMREITLAVPGVWDCGKRLFQMESCSVQSNPSTILMI